MKIREVEALKQRDWDTLEGAKHAQIQNNSISGVQSEADVSYAKQMPAHPAKLSTRSPRLKMTHFCNDQNTPSRILELHERSLYTHTHTRVYARELQQLMEMPVLIWQSGENKLRGTSGVCWSPDKTLLPSPSRQPVACWRSRGCTEASAQITITSRVPPHVTFYTAEPVLLHLNCLISRALFARFCALCLAGSVLPLSFLVWFNSQDVVLLQKNKYKSSYALSEKSMFNQRCYIRSEYHLQRRRFCFQHCSRHKTNETFLMKFH